MHEKPDIKDTLSTPGQIIIIKHIFKHDSKFTALLENLNITPNILANQYEDWVSSDSDERQKGI